MQLIALYIKLTINLILNSYLINKDVSITSFNSSYFFYLNLNAVCFSFVELALFAVNLA